MKKLLILTIAISLSSLLKAQTKTTAPKEPVQFCISDFKWTPAPPPLPEGAKICIMEGNPKDSGQFTLRLMLPPYYKIPVHSHPVDERVTIIRGMINLGFGDVMDTTAGKKLVAGCYYLNPAGKHHYIYTGNASTILQVSTTGPWGIDLVEEKK